MRLGVGVGEARKLFLDGDGWFTSVSFAFPNHLNHREKSQGRGSRDDGKLSFFSLSKQRNRRVSAMRPGQLPHRKDGKT